MAHSKHAHYRYNILDRCLRRHQNALSFKELLEEINEQIAELFPGEAISTRTLREDLALFRDPEKGFGAPIKVERHVQKEVYLYSDPNFSIALRGLLPQEQYLLDSAQQLLERFDDHPKYEKLSEAIVLFQEEEGAATIPEYTKILFYDKNEAYAGLSYLKPIFLAIKNKEVLKITYQGFGDTADKEYLFHPYVLKQYNQRWFVFGYNETNDVTRWSIPLDERLRHFEPLKSAVMKKDETDWNAFFNEMVGVRKQSVTNPDPIAETVVLKFAAHRLQYFKTKPIHPYWDEYAGEGKENQVFFETVINLELIQQLLSYGSDVEVLAPEGLKIKMKQQVEGMLTFYK